ncbi:LysR family substrate-binding domain-containing protein [Phenylobacterium sp.]|uniref:LysR family substrate-binding domain-containing protein n=1 Tax=Phenylobacterium sp. TaxID=1871053 RepID=UPI00272FEE6E|nr:LysR family substrate-binding domain-containing protein [Phenylobacterium sp.]MDP1599928.1 LysR family substrate-binding domain-containing protein [Phenylobacterium sp.]MDP3594390.1 LysR family substrate-binding domain-containing protein [Phenylobacterium sp.]
MDLSYRTYTSPISAWRTPRRHERLTLGVACSLNWGPLRDLIGRYRRRRPEVDLVIEDLDETSMADRIPGRRVDIAVALHDAGAPGWRSTPLWSEPLMAFMAEGHPLAACNSVPSAALRETPILMAGNGAGDRALQRAIIGALGGPPNFLHYAVQRDNLIDLTALGFGVTIAGGSALGAFYPGVCARPLESESAWLSYCAYWSAENERPALRRFLDAARGVEIIGA